MAAGRSSACPPCATNHWGSPPQVLRRPYHIPRSELVMSMGATTLEDKRRSSSVRDWFSLYMCDPRPAEGALLTRELLRQRRCYETNTCDHEPIRAAVAVDPSGGGRDTAGIIGGYLDRTSAYTSHTTTPV